ncbi:MAG: hypothetical protein DMG30_18320 [Acidobacteria bacterium]|nr:MAG: hypothetical protein DMG30_18320 [Acidobacteriota bacterium]
MDLTVRFVTSISEIPSATVRVLYESVNHLGALRVCLAKLDDSYVSDFDFRTQVLRPNWVWSNTCPYQRFRLSREKLLRDESEEFRSTFVCAMLFDTREEFGRAATQEAARRNRLRT